MKSTGLGGDSGFTLLELAIAMMIMAIGLVAVLGALVTGVNSGRILREATRAELALVGVADALRGTAGYVPCPSITASTYQPSHPRIEVSAIRHWNGEPTSPAVFLDDCPVIQVQVGVDPVTSEPIIEEFPVDYGLQQLDLSYVVDNANRDLDRRVTIVKRDPAWVPVVVP